MTQTGLLRIGLVGGGRTRNGLGPFLARFLERGGARVVGVVGRNADRAALAASELAGSLGHPVSAHGELSSLLDSEVLDALVIASPAATHLAALRAGLSAGLHVLCEKPLVALDQSDAVPELVAGFAERGRVLVENCQMPWLLPCLHRLYPELRGTPVREIDIGMGPRGVGREMVEDTLSHFLSVYQELMDGKPVTAVESVDYSCREPAARELTLRMQFGAGDGVVDGRLHLLHSPEQPRRLWLEVNGRRMDRRIELPEYRQRFRAGDREISAPDPLERLVYGFLQLIREPDVERTREHQRRIRERATLYREVLGGW